MTPRAEIMMVVASYGRSLGPWAVPGEVFGAMAVVVAATCIFAPASSASCWIAPSPESESVEDRAFAAT